MTDEHNNDQPGPIPAAPVKDEPWRLPALLAALALVGLEVMLLVGAAVWSLVTIATDGRAQVLVSVSLTVFLLLFALLLLAGAHALWNGRRWGRGPVITWQLIQAAIALSAAGSAPGWMISVAVGVAVVVVVGLLLPTSVAATSRTSSSSTVL